MLKRILMFILFTPFLLVALVIAFEIFGMIVNHAATAVQTRKLVKLAEAANETEAL